MRVSPELSTTIASKSTLQWVNTDSSQRSTSGTQPCATVNSVTARGVAGSTAWGGA
jgi:hypothetical protein